MPAAKQLLKVLIVEDDEDDFVLLNDYLKHLRAWKCEIKWIYKYDDAIKELSSNSYTICFCDYLLGAKNGIDLINDIQKHNCNTPVVLLTGKGNYQIDIEATRAGAFDYLIKADLDEDRLERTIRYTLERISNLQKIKDSERKYRNIFEKSKDILFITAIDTRIITINYAVTDVLDIPVEDALGVKLTSYFYQSGQVDSFLQLLEKDGELENYEVELITVNQLIKNCLITASIEVDSTGGNYIQGIIHDITVLKKAEQTSLQVEKLAATGRFIRTMAHEVRNPLNNISLSVENLVHQNTNEDDIVYLEIIERNSKRINTLITELLQSSRPVDIDFQPASLTQIVNNVINGVQDRLLLRKIDLRFIESENDCQIKADTQKLEMAILNLVINAIEAVADETGRIKIVSYCKPGQAGIIISDNGCGMNPETKARLFEPYFTSKRNGLGLGLTTTFTILNAHNATIEVSSQINDGTIFQITFPT